MYPNPKVDSVLDDDVNCASMFALSVVLNDVLKLGNIDLAKYPEGIDSLNCIGPVVKFAGSPFAVTLLTVAQIIFVGLL